MLILTVTNKRRKGCVMQKCWNCAREIKRGWVSIDLHFCGGQCRVDFFDEKIKEVNAALAQTLARVAAEGAAQIERLTRKATADYELLYACDVCGKWMETDRQYCGNACRQKAYRERKKLERG